MAFYDFLSGLGYKPLPLARMNLRYEHIVEPLKDEFKGARVLDLGSHDGRWPYAFASAGAESVFGIEGRADLIEQYAAYPEADFKGRVTLIAGDFVTEMDRLIAEGKTFDIVACLGVFYHTMHHYRMILQMAAFKPRIIIIDSPFSLSEEMIINVREEATGSKLNSIALAEDQEWVPVGEPSLPAMRLMAKSVGYGMKPVEWKVPPELRTPVAGYFNQRNRRRFTLIMRPVAAG